GIYRAAAGKTEEQPITQEQTVQRKDIVLPTFNEEVLLCSPAAKKVYDHEIEVVDAVDGTEAYQPMVFAYQLAKEDGTLEISQDPDFRTCRTFTLPKSEERIEIDNLLTGTDYYYRVLVGEGTYEGTFKTAESTRFVSIPGLKNTRDIGGYKTLDGRTVRQGLLIRGMEIDGLVETAYFIEKDRMEEVQELFGFVYDFDLRAADVFTGAPYQSRLGEDVGHRFYDSAQYGGIFQAAGAERVRYIFRDLAKPENYPMYFHCTYGQDRTGTMVFLLQSLLGMSEEDMIREYRLTAFWNYKLAEADYMDVIIDGMQSYPGDTLQEKVEYYMLNVVGITEAEIESIRSIFLE
ncbi:MAG: tyrosine-protein phosphatase, partial [Clostridia bacterium]|nr:tyrosine-protein phosphatase [Clostridia bacterium]